MFKGSFTFDCWRQSDRTLMESAECTLRDTLGDAWVKLHSQIELVSATPQNVKGDPDWFIAKVRFRSAKAARAVENAFRG